MKISSVEEGDNFFLNAHMAKHTQNPSITPSSSTPPQPQTHTHHSENRREHEGECSDGHTKILSTFGPTLDNSGCQYLQRCL